MLSGFPRWIGVYNVSRSYGFGGRSGQFVGWVHALKHAPQLTTVQGQGPQHGIAEHHKLHGRLLLTSEDGLAVDVVLYTSQMIDLIHVFILALHQHGDVVINGGSGINHQSHIARLTGVAILGITGFAAGHIVEHKQRAVVSLSPITEQQHGNLVFIVGTHSL